MSSASLPVPQHAYKVYTERHVGPSRHAGSSSSSSRGGSSSSKGRPPKYGKRANFVPRKPSDFGDGGAYPEIHVAQYPLNMGRPSGVGGRNGHTLSTTVDASGTVQFDAVVKRKDQLVHSTFDQLVEKDLTKVPLRPDAETEARTAERTSLALSKLIGAKVASTASIQAPETAATVAAKQEAKFIRYTPAGKNNQGKERVIKMVEAPVDPLEPPKFKRSKKPTRGDNQPVPVMHSPERKLTLQDQKDWTIPPCISNWKNPKGYTIALDKRLAADGRGMKEVTINDKFASVAEALYLAEKQAREMVTMRAKMEEQVERVQADELEKRLANEAQQALEKRTQALTNDDDDDLDDLDGKSIGGGHNGSIGGDASNRDARRREQGGERMSEQEKEAQIQRDRVRQELKREREREMRMEAAGKKTKTSRDASRDFSERIALGMANPNSIKAGADGAFDARLFNQEQGLGSGFAKDDEYGVYSKPLFNKDSQKVYRPKANVDQYGSADDQLKELRETKKFKPGKDFEGVDRSAAAMAAPRDGPVQFETEADQFDLDRHTTRGTGGGEAGEGARSGGRASLNNLGGRSGTMASSAGGGLGAGGADEYATSHRNSIRFKKASGAGSSSEGKK